MRVERAGVKDGQCSELLFWVGKCLPILGGINSVEEVEAQSCYDLNVCYSIQVCPPAEEVKSPGSCPSVLSLVDALSARHFHSTGCSQPVWQFQGPDPHHCFRRGLKQHHCLCRDRSSHWPRTDSCPSGCLGSRAGCHLWDRGCLP